MMHNRTFLFAAILLLISSIILLRLPLLNYLGYEFSIVIALMIPWFSGYLTIKRIRLSVAQASTSFDVRSLRRAVAGSFGQSLLLLMIPLVVASLNAFVVRNCSYFDGAAFFLLIPFVTVVWSVGFSSFCAVVVRRAMLLYTVATIVLLIYPLYLGYASPSINSYNPIYGFFPGFSYDESLTITHELFLFRILTIIAALFFFFLAEVFVERKIKNEFGQGAQPMNSLRAGFLLLSVLFLLGAWLFRYQLGFETSSDFIRRELGAKLETEHFDIYYSKNSFTGEEINWVGAEHEFRYHQVARALQVHPSDKVSSYIYPDADFKQRFIGTSSTNIAKPWRKEIHLNKDSWQQTLKHELVHVLAGEFGMPIIHAHYNIGLVEGLATAIDGEVGNRTLNEYAAAINVFGLITEPARLIRPVGFALRSSTVSYTLMGSFCRYLMNTYGILQFKELYGGRNVEEIYGRDYDALIAEWQNSLANVNVPMSWRNHVEFYFKRQSIFAKECARAVANINEEARRDLEAHHPIGAMKLFSQALITSWNSESYRGLIRSAYDASQYDTVISLVHEHMQDSVSRSSVLNLFLLYGDALWRRGDTSQARQAFRTVLDLDLSDRMDESAALRCAVLDNPHLEPALRNFFGSGLNDSTAENFLDSLCQQVQHPVLTYLKAKFDLRLHRCSEAISELDTMHGQFAFPILNAGQEQLLAQAYFRNKQFEKARVHFWQSLNYIANKASRERVEDLIEQCEWFEKNFMKE